MPPRPPAVVVSTLYSTYSVVSIWASRISATLLSTTPFGLGLRVLAAGGCLTGGLGGGMLAGDCGEAGRSAANPVGEVTVHLAVRGGCGERATRGSAALICASHAAARIARSGAVFADGL